MLLTPKRRWLRIVAAFFRGLFLGIIIVCGACYAFRSIALIIERVFTISEPPPKWVEKCFEVLGLLALAVVPTTLAIEMALKNFREQAAEFRLATNRCPHCGHSLSGIRRVRRQCPECGGMFRQLQ